MTGALFPQRNLCAWMTRYKRRANAKVVERDFPHFVDTVVPLGGLGSKLDAMYDFHIVHGTKPQHGQGRHDANGSVIRLESRGDP